MTNLTLMSKRSLAQASAIFFAIIIGHYCSMSEKFWLPLTTILVMQTSMGVALRQGIYKFIIIFSSVILGSLLVFIIHQVFAVDVFPIVNHDSLYARLYDITIGAIIGIVANILIFPTRLDKEFRLNVIPLLDAYSNYLLCITHLLFQKDHHHVENAEMQKRQLEKVLQAQAMLFPEWVYESGFSVTLRPGHRHFLVMIERVGQILFSMHYIARQHFDEVLLQTLKDPLNVATDQARKTIQAMITVLNLNKLNEGVSDLSEELDALESAFKVAVPLSIELLDMSKDYIYLSALIQDWKDLRTALVRLGQALR